jgi:hypothetical protein
MALSERETMEILESLSACGISTEGLEEKISEYDSIMARLADEMSDALDRLCRALMQLYTMQPGEMLDTEELRALYAWEPTAKKKRRRREQRDAAYCLRQYRATAVNRAVQKRTRPRRREWKGASRE